MGQALYRKYRTKTFSETVGQEHVTRTLENAIKQGKISHAYLFSGPHGVGKTSIARILAHEINGLPYSDESHLDIIEIDAASNRRIDEIRDLRERVNTAPAHAKYKVYIIDEVHMLTKEAFNALLKTLEEPPAHVVFILATTEAHKLPETIISRTQRYSLRPVPQERVIGHLRQIAKGEKLKIDDDALELIANHGEGSFRDSISLLDQASSTAEHITRQDVERILGLAPGEHIRQLITALTDNRPTDLVTTLSALYAQGYEAPMVAHQLGAQLRASVLDGTSASPQTTLSLLENLLNVAAARNPKQLLELILLQAALPPAGREKPTEPVAPAKQPLAPEPPAAKAASAPAAKPPAKPQDTAPPATPVSTTPAQPIAPPEPPFAPPAQLPTEPEPSSSLNDPSAQPVGDLDVTELWQQTLDQIKKQYNTLYGIARMAKPTLAGTQLTLEFKFAFHQKRINELKNRKIFADVFTGLSGVPVEIICIVAETAVASEAVAAVSNIFGGAEVLES